MKRVAFLIALLAVPVQAAPKAAAPSNRAQAKALYESAITHYNLSEYEGALKDFKEAYRLVKDPVLLFNLAQCHRQLRQFDESAKLYRAYRRELPNAPNRHEVDRLIVEMDEAVAEQRTHQPPTGTLPSEPEPVVAAPAPVVAPAVVTVTAAPKKDRPIYKKGWFWAVVVGAAAVVATGVAVGVVYGTKGDSTPGLPDVRF